MKVDSLCTVKDTLIMCNVSVGIKLFLWKKSVLGQIYRTVQKLALISKFYPESSLVLHKTCRGPFLGIILVQG